MWVKFKISGRWADPNDPRAPQIEVEAGDEVELNDKFAIAVCETGIAADLIDAPEGAEETVPVEEAKSDDPESSEKPGLIERLRAKKENGE